MRRLRLALLAAAMVLGARPLAAQRASTAPSDAEVLKRGSELTRWLLTGQADSAIALMSDSLRVRMGGREGIAQVASDLAGDLGRETSVHMETVSRGGGVVEYWRISSFSEIDDEPFVFHWVFDPSGTAVGVGLTSLSGTPAAK